MSTSNVEDGRDIKIEADLHQLLVRAIDQTGTTIRRIVEDALCGKLAKVEKKS